ncbi:tyrosine-type recombinase/integrase [Paracoccus fistulariae]|uniref:Tyrosine-type recombinase/integrase n=1 Tax=Paracoccus fistulariae TaxID=658446 RepID=A0ABY7SQ62_9RHOB|nr:tyrosine-type recombinase/integrase [Paracoccus fistulariae]MDB6183063.1 tyrosine-type recombinase/integrase [Paracoccus fistulariae]WCR09180.1 tyrosine-type recombinase/integrase [Paracoccus fistulariae]
MDLPITPLSLTPEEAEALTDLYRRGTPANTLRAWERDLAYISAWKLATYNEPLTWPESEPVALRFLTDHSTDLTDRPGPAQQAAQALISLGLRRSLACPAPATLDRRVASWRAFHRMKNLPSPFEAPLVAQARGRARRAAARPTQRKSGNPITRPVLEAMLTTCDHSHRGLRDRALLMLGWASGGRRRSEISALNLDDIHSRDFAERGLLRVRLLTTKTTGPDAAPRLPLKGRPARAVMDWIRLAGLLGGPLFRHVSQADRVLKRRLGPDGVRDVIRHRLELAGYPPDFASAHGLRAGFLTQAALDGAPLPAAMQLSLHRSANQAQRYYADVEITDNPATDLLG